MLRDEECLQQDDRDGGGVVRAAISAVWRGFAAGWSGWWEGGEGARSKRGATGCFKAGFGRSLSDGVDGKPRDWQACGRQESW